VSGAQSAVVTDRKFSAAEPRLDADAAQLLGQGFAELQANLDPLVPFREGLALLKKSMQRTKLPRVRLVAGPTNPTSPVFTRRRSISWLGYKIFVSPEFYRIIRDATELYGARIAIISQEGHILQPPDQSEKGVIEAISHKIVGAFLGQWPFSRFDFSRAERSGDEMFMAASQRRSGILSFLTLQGIVFTLAHELGHIALGHSDRPLPGSKQDRREEENEADLWATNAIINFIPAHSIFLSRFGEAAAEHRRLWQVGLVSGVCLIFAIFEAMADAAKALDLRWDEEYPPAWDRYLRVKQNCIEGHNFPLEIFTGYASNMAVPEPFIQRFLQLIKSIDWQAAAAAHRQRDKEATAELVGRATRNQGQLETGVALGKFGQRSKKRNAEAIAVYDDMIARLGNESDLALREEIAQTLLLKGATLRQFGRSEQEIAVYDDVIARFGAASDLSLREQVARALMLKGMTLRRLGRSEQQIAVFDDVIARFGAASDLSLHEQVARALILKGMTLGELGQGEQEIAVYDDMITRFGRVSDVSLREQLARALLQKALTLGQLGQREAAIAVFEDIVVRFADAEIAVFKEVVEQARNLRKAFENRG